MEQEDKRQWTGRTDGTPLMHRWLQASLRVLPLWMVYVPMATLVVPGYMLFAHKGYIAQYRFARKRLHHNPLRAFWNVYCNHCRFGQIIIDRFYFYAGGKFKFDISNYDLYKKLSAASEGFVVLSSHVGNYELAGYELKAKGKMLYALVFSGEGKEIMNNRNRLLVPNNIRLIPIADDMSHLFQLSNALADNNIVSIHGDRVFGSPRAIKCRFFDSDAPFPLGPFTLATQRDVPVISVSVMKTGIKRYHIIIHGFDVDHSVKRVSERAANLAKDYAAHLEEIVRQYPTQWFNFYDFWQDSDK